MSLLRPKSHLRNQKRFHSRLGFGYGILLYIRKKPHFRPLTAHFGGSRGIFSYKIDKSALACPDKTEVADFVSFKGSIVQGMILLDKLEFVKYFLPDTIQYILVFRLVQVEYEDCYHPIHIL